MNKGETKKEKKESKYDGLSKFEQKDNLKTLVPFNLQNKFYSTSFTPQFFICPKNKVLFLGQVKHYCVI